MESKFVEIFVLLSMFKVMFKTIYILYIYNFILYKKKGKTEHIFNTILYS